MKRVLLTHSYFLQFDQKQWSLMKPYAPLGTLYAAALLRERGYEVTVWDPMFASDASEIIPQLELSKADVLVIYDDGFNYLTKMCLTNMRDAAFKMIGLAAAKNIPIIISSSDSTDHYEKYLDIGATVIIKGEGEITLTEVIKALSGNEENLNVTDGIAFRKEGQTRITRSREVMRDPGSLPFPAWDLIDMNRYKKKWLKNHGYFSINMSTTRGCPFKCNWCAKPIYGNRYNSRSVENVADELIYLKNIIGFDHVWFCDDIFGLKPQWVNHFADVLSAKDVKISYTIQSRADLLLQENYVSSLALSGCKTAWMGAESGSQKILDAMDKGTRVEQIHEATTLLKKHNIQPAFFLQFGYPGENSEDIDMTINMVMDLMPEDIGISVSYPLPGTVFYENVKSELQQKSNWTDSDDLSLMFKNTYPAGYYKHLHRYVHKKYRRHQGSSIISETLNGNSTINKLNIRRMAGVIYHLPGEWYHHKKMNDIKNQHKSQKSTTVKNADFPFDLEAEKYDEEFTFSIVGKMQREVVRNYIRKNISPIIYKKTLEINCGTGEDAYWLSSRGHAVLATDASALMIETAKKKNIRLNYPNLTFIKKSFDEIDSLQDNNYDFIFSNFGGINCIPPHNVTSLAKSLKHKLRPGGKIIVIVMGRKTLLEKIYFLFKGDYVGANRRKSKDAVVANLNNASIQTWYYSPDELSKLFDTELSEPVYRPVGFFIPPSYLNNKFIKIPGLANVAGLLEKLTTLWPGLADYSDHYLAEFTKK